MVKKTNQVVQTGPKADLPQFPPIGLAIAVEDIKQASKFYQRLGFQLMMTLPGSNGKLAFAWLMYGSSALLLGPLDEPHYESKARANKIRKGPRGLGVTLILYVPDLKKVYNAVKKANLKILLEPRDEFYGDRIFVFIDPYGYEWKIGQTIKQLSFEELAEIAISASAINNPL